MKDKVLIFIMGMLVGAIITTICFLVYNRSIESTVNNTNEVQVQDGPMGEPPELPTDENGNTLEGPDMPDGNNMGNPPAKPDGNNGERPEMPSGGNMGEPPARPEDSNKSTDVESNNV